MRTYTWQGISIFTEHKDCVKLLQHCRTALPGLLLLLVHPGYSSLFQAIPHRSVPHDGCGQGSTSSSQTSPGPGVQYCSLDSHTDILWWVSEEPGVISDSKHPNLGALCFKKRAGKGTRFWGMFLRYGLRQGIDIVAPSRDGSEEIPSHCQMQSRFCR